MPELLGNVRFWIEHKTFPADEIAPLKLRNLKSYRARHPRSRPFQNRRGRAHIPRLIKGYPFFQRLAEEQITLVELAAEFAVSRERQIGAPSGQMWV